jgi:hypothetical protein
LFASQYAGSQDVATIFTKDELIEHLEEVNRNAEEYLPLIENIA